MNSETKNSQKVLLIVRDGWGYSPDIEYNMIAQADTPYTDYLEKTYPTILLNASGESVGLPDGYFGNSEVGHMTIGAGRALEQSLLRINNSIKDGSFFENKKFLEAINLVKEKKSRLHLLGLLQKEGVHAHFDHLVALLELAKQQGLGEDSVYIHVITDGRDMEEQHAIHYISDLEIEIERIGVGKIVTLSGRYFAMDRNKNWERTKKYYNSICRPSSFSGFIPDKETFSNPKNYLTKKYQDSEFSDEFLKPVIHEDYDGINEGDSIINFSFRKDRERQIAAVFSDENFPQFETFHKNIHFISMTEYYEGLKNVAFPDIEIKDILGKILEENNKTQLRISETEKYAHVTFFFDGGEDYDFTDEKKILISSPDVATFDLQPEMASVELSEKLISEIENTGQDFILCNFPNADMVGHSGKYEAIKKGVNAVDVALSRIIPKAIDNGYVILLTADHGNAEFKHDDHETSHTLNPVQFTFISNKEEFSNLSLLSEKGLENIASTVLKIMKIDIPNVYKKPLF